MLIFTIIFLSILLILYVISFNFQKEFTQTLTKKEHPLKFFYSLVAYIRHFILKKDENLNQIMRSLIYKKSAAAILCLISFLFLILLVELQSLSKPQEIINNTIQRPMLGEGEKTVDAVYKSMYGDEQIKIHISEKVLQGDARDALFRNAEAKLDSVILGENTSSDHITHDLYFPKSISDSNISISYEISNPDLLKRDGSIKSESISAEGNHTSVTVTFRYEDSKYKKVYEFQIYPKTLSQNQMFHELVEQQLQEEENTSKSDNTLKLPSNINNVDLEWQSKNKNTSFILLVLGIVITCFIPILIERSKKEKEEKRMNQMKKDYPEIISKFQLLLTAGMTTKGAWERIVFDYEQTKQQMNEKNLVKNVKVKTKQRKEYSRAAYEEMIITKREQELGMTEGLTYERFGKRCKMIAYLRFSTILTQNLRMGSRNIAQLLEQEAREAFNNRKDQAKQLGEKASTKLLGPTMGMLMIILVIILVPAFMQF